ncbi:MAG TPA: hypothetical protein PK967_07440 [Candidatus Hydrogenedentes bacterium]|nr:hypothetical protein [Candidatus Hydrogenedentota bacterium]
MLQYFIALEVASIALLILENLRDAAGIKRQEFEMKRDDVQASVEEHRRNIEIHLSKASESCNFHTLTSLHYSSWRVADQAHRLLHDAVDVRDAQFSALRSTSEKMRQLYNDAKKLGVSRDEQNALHNEIRELKKLKEYLRGDLKVFSENVCSLKAELRNLNEQTRLLKFAVRDRCGTRGRDWFARLEARVASRRKAQ